MLHTINEGDLSELPILRSDNVYQYVLISGAEQGFLPRLKLPDCHSEVSLE